MQMGQMANTFNRMEEGKLPSQLVANPKGHYMAEASTSNHQQMLAITTLRSGRMVDNHVQEKVDEHTEIPQNLQKDTGKQVNTKASSSSAPTLEIPYEPRVPSPKHLKAPSHFGKQGEKIQDMMEVFKQVKSILQHSLPPKFKDPGAPTISCIIGDHKIDKALLDLRAGVNLFPYSVYMQLGLGELKPTPIILQLADQSIKKPRGIIEDVIIQVNNFYFPMDFIVLDTKPVDNPKKMIPVILGRPFLATANENINCRTGIMMIRFENLKVNLNMFHTFQQPLDKAECFFLDSIENLVAEPPPCILTKDPFEVGMTHIKVDNCDTGQSIGQANYWLPTTTKLDVPPLAISRTSRLLLPGNILS
ncbi:uncharacterized protein LOC133871523 [Alnus glutinosa]|uniref:uncharacterized protein LOC133871523 n=1 Tax=Alnus glutinosa TaxID=3517 RepID=UPI002D79EE64|nr:uncharacterized protein LOC133871523 [Alnus glutinosa]